MDVRRFDGLRVLRSVLSAQRRAGVDFDTAWGFACRQAIGAAAMGGVIEGECMTRALNATRHVWEQSYGGPLGPTADHGLGLLAAGGVVSELVAVVRD